MATTSGAGADGSLPGPVTNNSLLIFDNYASQTFGGTISGSGGGDEVGLGLLTFVTAQSYSGSTTINGGTLELGNGQAGHDASLDRPVVKTTASWPSTMRRMRRLPGRSAGNGVLTTLGSHTLTLTNIETYTGRPRSRPARCSLATDPGPQRMAGNIDEQLRPGLRESGRPELRRKNQR